MLDMRSTAHTVCSERPLIGATRLFMVVVVESTAVYGFYSWARGWELGALKQLGRALVQLVVRRSRQQRSREGGGGELREKCFIDVCAIALVSAHRPAAPPPPPTPARARERRVPAVGPAPPRRARTRTRRQRAAARLSKSGHCAASFARGLHVYQWYAWQKNAEYSTSLSASAVYRP